MSIGIRDASVTSATAEITNGHLIITIAGGTTNSLDFDLSNPRYDTIGGLYDAISRAGGYTANLAEDADRNHSSTDIAPFGPLNIQTVGCELVHHLFSDNELEDIARDATHRHNPSLSLATLPPQEWAFVFPLAHANILRTQAMDATKRRGLSEDVSSLLELARSYEEQYTADTQRLARAIQSPREANANIVDEGDVMLGTLFRRSGRTGFMSPLASVIPPDAAKLLDPNEHDIEDSNVRVVWERNKNFDFYSYELWMDTTPDVVRSRDGGLIPTGAPISQLTTDDTRYEGAVRRTSSVMVFRSFGGNSNASRSSFATFVEEFGQMIRSFAVGNLESQSTYYFRLYVQNVNYDSIGSNVVKAVTRPLRARFIQYNALSLTSGKPGAVVTVTCDPTKGQFTSQHVFKIGGKVVATTILTPYTFSFVVPSFENYGPKDVVIVSPTKLLDVISYAFTVYSP